MITHSQLRELLSYDPATGEFRWLVKPSAGTRAGSVAGHVDPIKGYMRITIKRRRYLAHRLAWLHVHGEFPSLNVDHINGRRDDNRIVNLRTVEQSLNVVNSRPRNPVPEMRGVVRDKKKWRATGRLGGKYINIGSFERKEDAISARIKHELAVYGEIACRDQNRVQYLK